MESIVKYQVSNNLDDLQRTAKLLAMSGYFDVKGTIDIQIAQMATKILAGAELGYGPFAAVNGIHIIQGKPAIGANLMAAAVKNHPHYDYRVVKMTDDEVSIDFYEIVNGKREKLGNSTFTKKDAEVAGLLSNPTWKKYPRNMAFARAMSNGVRFYTPDVFNGNAVYVPEELGAEIDGEGNVVETIPGAEYVVVSDTGEIVDRKALTKANGTHPEETFTPPEPNPWDGDDAPAKPKATAAQLAEIDELGRQVYGEKWGVNITKLAQWASTGSVSRLEYLLAVEAEKALGGLKKKLPETEPA